MKTHQIVKSIQYYTGIMVREYEIIRWANEGYLGEVVRFGLTTPTSKQRDFNDKNFERALLVVFLLKVLNMPWNKEQLLNYLNTNDKDMANDICSSLDKLERKGLPRLKHILLDRENKSGI